MKTREGNVLVLVLAGIAVISLALAGYFFYQNQKLQKPKIEPVAPTPTPVVDETDNSDSIGANWKTYRTDFGMEFKYPANVSLPIEKVIEGETMVTFSLNPSFGEFRIEKYPIKDLVLTGGGKKLFSSDFPLGNPKVNFYFLGTGGASSEQEMITQTAVHQKLFDQILGTFMFLDSDNATGTLSSKETLIEYFNLLNSKNYEEALKLYGGDVYTLIYWNPNVPKEERAQLIKNGCEENGLHCLRIKEIVSEKVVSPTETKFIVRFQNDDGTLWKRGPCCGANEATMPTKTDFDYTVTKVNGIFKVMELPQFTP